MILSNCLHPQNLRTVYRPVLYWLGCELLTAIVYWILLACISVCSTVARPTSSLSSQAASQPSIAKDYLEYHQINFQYGDFRGSQHSLGSIGTFDMLGKWAGFNIIICVLWPRRMKAKITASIGVYLKLP